MISITILLATVGLVLLLCFFGSEPAKPEVISRKICEKTGEPCPNKIYVSGPGVLSQKTEELVQCCRFKEQIEAVKKLRERNLIKNAPHVQHVKIVKDDKQK